MTIASGRAMIFNWWRKRAEQMKRQGLSSQRRRLAFERLEERSVPSAKPILSGAAGLLLAEQPGNLPAMALSAGNDGLVVSPLIVDDGSELGGACPAEFNPVTGDTNPMPDDQNVLTIEPLQQSGQ